MNKFFGFKAAASAKCLTIKPLIKIKTTAIMIKTTFNPGNYSPKISLILLLLRLGVGGLMLVHGVGKFSMLFADAPIQFADPLGIGLTTSLALTVFAEVLCSILLMLGLATRLATIPLIITMLVAVLIIHATDDIGKKEMPLLYLLIYMTIGMVGAGAYSIDNLIYKNQHQVV